MGDTGARAGGRSGTICGRGEYVAWGWGRWGDRWVNSSGATIVTAGLVRERVMGVMGVMGTEVGVGEDAAGIGAIGAVGAVGGVRAVEGMAFLASAVAPVTVGITSATGTTVSTAVATRLVSSVVGAYGEERAGDDKNADEGIRGAVIGACGAGLGTCAVDKVAVVVAVAGKAIVVGEAVAVVLAMVAAAVRAAVLAATAICIRDLVGGAYGEEVGGEEVRGEEVGGEEVRGEDEGTPTPPPPPLRGVVEVLSPRSDEAELCGRRCNSCVETACP